MTPTWISICASICEGRPLLRRPHGGGSPQPHSNLGKGRRGQLKHMTESPPPMVKGLPIFSTVVLRTINVDPATCPTVMGEVCACPH